VDGARRNRNDFLFLSNAQCWAAIPLPPDTFVGGGFVEWESFVPLQIKREIKTQICRNMAKTSIITVQDIPISISVENDKDYICLTDMIKAKDGEFFISDWLRNKDTIEYVGTWESLYNPNFNYGEFTTIKNEAGSRAYRISVKDWVKRTNAIGIIAKSGRYGGTYAPPPMGLMFSKISVR
jgi:hypothetical protein